MHFKPNQCIVRISLSDRFNNHGTNFTVLIMTELNFEYTVFRKKKVDKMFGFGHKRLENIYKVHYS